MKSFVFLFLLYLVVSNEQEVTGSGENQTLSLSSSPLETEVGLDPNTTKSSTPLKETTASDSAKGEDSPDGDGNPNPDDNEKATEIYKRSSAERTMDIMVGLLAIIVALYITLYVTNRWQDVIYFLSRLRQRFQNQDQGYGMINQSDRGPAMPDAYDLDVDEELRKLEQELNDVSLSDEFSVDEDIIINDDDYSLDSC